MARLVVCLDNEERGTKVPCMLCFCLNTTAQNIEKQHVFAGKPQGLTPILHRQEYGEVRYVAMDMLGKRLHVLCFTEIPDGIRVISFRKANSREVARYAKVQTTD